jgi:hypothetical protein
MNTVIGGRENLEVAFDKEVFEAMEEQRMKMVSLNKYNSLKAQNEKLFAENKTIKIERGK